MEKPELIIRENLENIQNTETGISFARYALQTFLTIFLTQFIYLGTSIIIARTLGPDGKGTVTILILYPTLLFTLGHLSIYRALTVNIAEKKYPLVNFPATVLVYVIFATIFMGLIFVGAYFNFNKYFIHGISSNIILLSLSLLPFFLIIQTFNSILEVKAKISRINFMQVAQSIIFAVCIVTFLMIFKNHIAAIISSYLVTNMVAACLLVYFVRKIFPGKWLFDFSLLKKIIKDGSILHIAVIANFITLRIDMLMLGYYRQTSSVGYYSIAVCLAELLQLASISVQTVFYSRIPDMLSDKNQLIKKTVAVYKHGLMIFASFAVLIALFSRLIIILFYGNQFLPALRPLIILLPGVLILYSCNTLINYLISIREFLKLSIAFSICSFLNLILNVSLIPKYDASGAAVASSICYITQGFLVFLIFFKTSKYKLSELITELSFSSGDFNIYKNLLIKIFSKLKRP